MRLRHGGRERAASSSSAIRNRDAYTIDCGADTGMLGLARLGCADVGRGTDIAQAAAGWYAKLCCALARSVGEPCCCPCAWLKESPAG